MNNQWIKYGGLALGLLLLGGAFWYMNNSSNKTYEALKKSDKQKIDSLTQRVDTLQKMYANKKCPECSELPDYRCSGQITKLAYDKAKKEMHAKTKSGETWLVNKKTASIIRQYLQTKSFLVLRDDYNGHTELFIKATPLADFSTKDCNCD